MVRIKASRWPFCHFSNGRCVLAHEGNIGGYLPGVGILLAPTTITNAPQTSDAVPAAGFDHLMLFLSYERGAAGGEVQLTLEVQAAADGNWYQQGAFAVGAVASGSDTVSAIQRQSVRYGATGASAETVAWGPIDLARGIEAWRVTYIETGDPAHPGDLGIAWTMTTDG